MNKFAAGVDIHENGSSNIVPFITGPKFDDSLRNFTEHPLTDGSCFLKASCTDYTPEEMAHLSSSITGQASKSYSSPASVCYVFLPIKEYMIDFIFKRKDINNYLCI